MTALVLLGNEAWTEEELRDALEHPRCGHPTQRALTTPQVADVVRRYNGVAWGWRSQVLSNLAAEYGVTTRTIQRYVAAHRTGPLPCPGRGCLTITPAGRLCHFCSRSELPARATLDVAGAYNGPAGERDSAQPA